jgi:hypothetical protein
LKKDWEQISRQLRVGFVKLFDPSGPVGKIFQKADQGSIIGIEDENYSEEE